MTDQTAKLRELHTNTKFRDMSARGVKGFLHSSLALLLGLGLVACGSTPPTTGPSNSIPPSSSKHRIFGLGSFNLFSDSNVSSTGLTPILTSTSALLDIAVSNLQTDSRSSTYDLITRKNYLWIKYSFTNQSGSDLNNLTFYAINQPNKTVGGTALKNLFDLNGPNTDINIARAFLPIAASAFNSGTVTFNYGNTQYQTLTRNEASQVTTEGRQTTPPTLTSSDQVLEYGFAAVNATGGRTIAAGAKGYLVLALQRPIFNDTTSYGFGWTFLLSADNYVRVSRAPGETTASAVARAQAAGATQLGLVGTDTDVAPAPLQTVRNPDPLNYVPDPVDLSSGVSLSNTVSAPGTAVVFDASGVNDEGLTYAWNFGDGSSSTEPYATHQYSARGNYTAKLTVTDKAGRVTTIETPVEVLPQMREISPDLTLKGKDKAVFDAGPALDGLTYDWDFGTAGTAQGARVEKDFPTLGTYTVKLKVTDTRPFASASFQGGVSARSSLNAQSGGSTVAFADQTWLTRWEPKPKAKFTLTNSAGANNSIGAAPFLLNFDASTSTTPDGSIYTWNFGDGSPEVSGKTVSHTFTISKRYITTLTVTDPKNQKDTYRAAISVRDPQNFIRPVFEYPGLLGALSSDGLSSAELPLDGHRAVERIGATSAGLSSAEVSGADELYYPYVLHKGVKFTRATTRWNAWSNGSNYQASLCVSVFAKYNGGDIPSTQFVRYDQDFNPTEFCDFMSVSSGQLGPLQVRNSSLLTLVGRNLQLLNFDVVDELRVPRVYVSIQDDRLIPGDQATPWLTENILDIGGIKEITTTVRARQSDLKNGVLEFKVPVYAVNAAGNRAIAVSGIFVSKFEGLDSDCGDCVMEKGKTYITVRVKVADYGVLQNTRLDFTKIRLSSNATDCTRDTNAWAGDYGMRGCITVTASYKAPLGVEELEAFKYPDLELRTKFFGQTLYGERAEAVQKFYDYTTTGFFNDAYDWTLAWTPYGSVDACWNAVSKAVNEGKANPFALGTGCAAAAIDAYPLYKKAKLVVRIADYVGSSLRKAVEAIFKDGAAAGKTLPQIHVDLDQAAGKTLKALEECGQSCVNEVESSVKVLVTNGNTPINALKKVEGAIGNAISKGSNARAEIDFLSGFPECLRRGLFSVQSLPGNLSATSIPSPTVCPLNLPSAQQLLSNATLFKGRKFPNSANPGEVLYRADQSGVITRYQVYGEDGFPVKRVDLVGAPHAGIPTPHVTYRTRGTDPATGQTFVGKETFPRAALPEEIP